MAASEPIGENYIITPKSSITAIADAIRLAGGGTEGLSLAQMPDEIVNLKPNYETYNVNIYNKETGGSYTVHGTIMEDDGTLVFFKKLDRNTTTSIKVLKDSSLTFSKYNTDGSPDGLMQSTFTNCILILRYVYLASVIINQDDAYIELYGI